MSAFSIDVNIRDMVSSLMGAAEALPLRLDEGVGRAAFETGSKMKAGAPRAHETLVGSIKPDHVELMVWKVGPHVDYAEAVEEGTLGGGFVPFDVLFSWIKAKGIQPRNPEWDMTDLTLAIQKKILMKGSPAQPFAKPLVESGFVEQKLRQLLEQKSAQAFAEAGL